MTDIRYYAGRRGDDAGFADWMLALVDQSPERTGVIEIPRASDEELDACEDRMRRAFAIAQRQRPRLVVTVRPATQELCNSDVADVQAVLVVHEHEWVGGLCVRGCATREDDRPAATERTR
jgi:hypothetical protein